MSDHGRRPHWDDDLLDAVRDAVDVEFDDIWKLSEDSILCVIAAVEDWLDATDNPLPHVLDECLKDLTAERSKIARVRELCEDYFHDRSDLDAVESLEAIRRALDGEQ